MSRARCYAAYADAAGNKLSGTSVYVYNPGTTNAISETIYDSFTAGGALSNPLTTDANGGVLFYLAAPKRVDLKFLKAGYADFTLRDVQVLPDAADILLLATGGTMGAGAALDLSAMGATTFKPPAAAGAAPATDGALAYDSTAKAIVFGDGTIHHHVATLDAGSIPAAALAADVRPCVYAFAAALSVASNVDTALPLDSEGYDTDNMHDNAIDNGRITFNTAGIYEVTISLIWDTNGAGYRLVYVYNQSSAIVAQSSVVAVPGNATTQLITFSLYYSAGDFLSLTVYQSSGGALTLYTPRIFAKRIG